MSHVIYVISDGTGETAMTMIRAALVQYPDKEVRLIRCKNVRTEMQLEALIDEVSEKTGMVAHTVASQAMRVKIQELTRAKNILSIDLLGPLLIGLDEYMEVSNPDRKVGILRTVDDQYFKRIAAIEYTVKHDDGKCLTDLDQADVLLVGISRTSKTPLSIFLSHKGWKVANIPLVLGQPVPPEVFEVDQRKIVGLIIDIESLRRIRRSRLEKYRQDAGSEYASLAHIQKEIEYAHEIFKQNKRWPVFNVTERALEETASEITRIVAARMGWPDSALF